MAEARKRTSAIDTERILGEGIELCRQRWTAALVVLGAHTEHVRLRFVESRHPELRHVARHAARRPLPRPRRPCPLLYHVVPAIEILHKLTTKIKILCCISVVLH